MITSSVTFKALYAVIEDFHLHHLYPNHYFVGQYGSKSAAEDRISPTRISNSIYLCFPAKAIFLLPRDLHPSSHDAGEIHKFFSRASATVSHSSSWGSGKQRSRGGQIRLAFILKDRYFVNTTHLRVSCRGDRVYRTGALDIRPGRHHMRPASAPVRHAFKLFAATRMCAAGSDQAHR